MGHFLGLSGTGHRLLAVGVGVAIALSLQPAADAGILDFLFGRRDTRGRPTGREQGGAVRSGRLLGGDNPAIPFILTPRNTFHLDDHFMIEWHPVVGVDSYTVRLWRWDDAYGERDWLVWETQTDQTAVIYNGEIPLQPARFYSVEVITDTGISSDLDTGCASIGFALLFEENRNRLRQQLEAVDLNDPQVSLQLADIYLNNGMVDYAITALEQEAVTTSDPRLHLALAELYSLAGLNQAALDQYHQAKSLGAIQFDLMMQAMALEGIGSVQSTQLKIDAAIDSLQTAERFYRAEAADLPAQRLAQRIENLQRFPQDLAAQGATGHCQPPNDQD